MSTSSSSALLINKVSSSGTDRLLDLTGYPVFWKFIYPSVSYICKDVTHRLAVWEHLFIYNLEFVASIVCRVICFIIIQFFWIRYNTIVIDSLKYRFFCMLLGLNFLSPIYFISHCSYYIFQLAVFFYITHHLPHYFMKWRQPPL